jgi:hypothetical protein
MDHFCVGFYRDMTTHTTPRYNVVDGDGKLFRGNGFRRCERIQPRTGAILVAAFPYIGDRPGKSVWYWRRHLKELQDFTAANAEHHARPEAKRKDVA